MPDVIISEVHCVTWFILLCDLPFRMEMKSICGPKSHLFSSHESQYLPCFSVLQLKFKKMECLNHGQAGTQTIVFL